MGPYEVAPKPPARLAQARPPKKRTPRAISPLAKRAAPLERIRLRSPSPAKKETCCATASVDAKAPPASSDQGPTHSERGGGLFVLLLALALAFADPKHKWRKRPVPVPSRGTGSSVADVLRIAPMMDRVRFDTKKRVRFVVDDARAKARAEAETAYAHRRAVVLSMAAPAPTPSLAPLPYPELLPPFAAVLFRALPTALLTFRAAIVRFVRSLRLPAWADRARRPNRRWN